MIAKVSQIDLPLLLPKALASPITWYRQQCEEC